jgi:hypothetical protein
VAIIFNTFVTGALRRPQRLTRNASPDLAGDTESLLFDGMYGAINLTTGRENKDRHEQFQELHDPGDICLAYNIRWVWRIEQSDL